jgi:sugar lactone lactonase YvrE
MHLQLALLLLISTSVMGGCGPGIVNYPLVSLESTSLDPLLLPGDTQTFRFVLDTEGKAIVSLSYAFSNDGKTFSSETALATTAQEFTHSIPASASSSTAAQYRLTVTDSYGISSSTYSPTFQIVTLVDDYLGDAYYAAGSVDGSATQTRFLSSNGLATDGTYLYVTDQTQIRRVSIADGSTITLAGKPGVSRKVDGVGTEARFRSLRGVAVLNNTLYIVDAGDQTIRQMDINPFSASYLTVSTFAGTSGTTGSTNATGTAASFRNPLYITTDGTSLYVADQGNYLIRKITVGGVVTTFAGGVGSTGFTNGIGTAARFSAPAGITYDAGTLSLYVSDEGAAPSIRKIVVSSATVSTLAGTLGRIGTNDGTASQAAFLTFRGMDTDGTYLYATDTHSNTIRKIEIATGTTTTIGGVALTPGYLEGASGTSLYAVPYGIVYHGGYLYVSDAVNMVLRRINTATGVSELFSGFPYGRSTAYSATNSSLYSNNAMVDYSYGIATNDGNTIYYASAYNHTIRQFDRTLGTITTIAGSTGIVGTQDGTGSGALLNRPQGMALAGGNLYFCDFGSNTIRQLNLTTNAVTTIAGQAGVTGNANNATGTSATFNQPADLTTDGTNLYVADTGNHRIRTVALSGGYAVSTFAGSTSGNLDGLGTAARFSNPWGIAIDGTNSNLYVADSGNHTIRQVALSNAQVTVVAGSTAGIVDGVGTAAKFSGPRGVTVSGSLMYVADYNNHRLRQVDIGNSFAVTTILGGISWHTSLANGIGVSSAYLTSPTRVRAVSGTLFFTSITQKIFRSMNLSTGQVKAEAGFSSNMLPGLVAGGSVDGAASLMQRYRYQTPVLSGAFDGEYVYLPDYYNCVIDKVSPSGTSVSTAVGQAGNCGIADGTGSAATLNAPAALAYDSGYVYFIDRTAFTVRRFSTSSLAVTTLAGTAGTSGNSDGTGTAAVFGVLNGIAVLGENLYVTDQTNHTIRRIGISSGEVSTVAGSGASGNVDATGVAAQFNTPKGIVALGGMLYVADTGNHTLRKIDPATFAVTTVAGNATEGYAEGTGTAAILSSPTALFTDGTYLYIGDLGNYLVRRFAPSTQVVTNFAGLRSVLVDAEPAALDSTGIPSTTGLYVPGYGVLLLGAPRTKLVR